ncbi:Cysteine desulfurase [Sesbania bispinosa]|nr:Cysteine desulfurase [Sesbania bispinosa]
MLLFSVAALCCRPSRSLLLCCRCVFVDPAAVSFTAGVTECFFSIAAVRSLSLPLTRFLVLLLLAGTYRYLSL